MNRSQLEQIFKQPIVSVQSISGGDIAQAQRIDTKEGQFFVKSASFPNAKELFEKEVQGLKELKKSNTIGIPDIIGTYSFGDHHCLILDYIATKPAESHEMAVFGRQLAALHLSAKTDLFGFESNNLIGRLPQNNSKNKDWSTFYVEGRLLPQFELAYNQGLLGSSEIPQADICFKRCNELFGKVEPCLLHGDLWSGNYFIDMEGSPYLIDPSVYYGHNEVDLAMTKLFGGFSNAFYDAYYEIIPPHENLKDLVDIYQLYYLLVHLNLFGISYRPSVHKIIKNYLS